MPNYEYETKHVVTNDGFRVTVVVESTTDQSQQWEEIEDMAVAVPVAQAAVDLANNLIIQERVYYGEV